MKAITLTISIVLVALFVCSCNDDNPIINQYSIDTDFKLMDTNNVEKTTFKQDENIQFYLRIKNTGDAFTFGKGSCAYGIFKIYSTDTLMGTHLDCVICSAVYTIIPFNTNDSLIERAFWVTPCSFNQHNYLIPGNYKAVVTSAGIFNEDKSELILFDKYIEFNVIE